jgi:hypothetical protein
VLIETAQGFIYPSYQVLLRDLLYPDFGWRTGVGARLYPPAGSIVTKCIPEEEFQQLSAHLEQELCLKQVYVQVTLEVSYGGRQQPMVLSPSWSSENLHSSRRSEWGPKTTVLQLEKILSELFKDIIRVSPSFVMLHEWQSYLDPDSQRCIFRARIRSKRGAKHVGLSEQRSSKSLSAQDKEFLPLSYPSIGSSYSARTLSALARISIPLPRRWQRAYVESCGEVDTP